MCNIFTLLIHSITKSHRVVPLGNTADVKKLNCFTVRTYFYSQAVNKLPPMYCMFCRVEGKPGLITVGRILLNYIFILCKTNFVPELQSHFVFSAAELALKRNILLYNDLLSFRVFFGLCIPDKSDKCTFLSSNFAFVNVLHTIKQCILSTAPQVL
jgi:hypothetical protein